MKWVQGIVLMFFIMTGGRAQPFHLPARSACISGTAYSEHFADAFSFTVDPAVLGSAKTFQAGLSSERRWMLKALDYYRMACSFPAGGGGIGLLFHYTGNSGYNETVCALAYGKDLGRISLGMQFRYDLDQTAGYNSWNSGSVVLGLRFHPSGKLCIESGFSTPVFNKMGKRYPERAAGNYNMGFGYEASSLVFLSVRLEKEAGAPINVIGCLDYRWNEQFYASLGIESFSASPCIKAGWKKNRLTIELFTAFHVQLGFTPGLLVLWTGKTDPDEKD